MEKKVGTKKHFPSLSVQRSIRRLGEDIHRARLRRYLQTETVSQRAGISRVTLAKIEKGSYSVSIGMYASVLQALALLPQLDLVLDKDHVGQMLADNELPKRIRATKG